MRYARPTTWYDFSKDSRLEVLRRTVGTRRAGVGPVLDSMMLSLFARDDYAALGLAALLDVERIPYRRIRSLTEHDQSLLVVGGDDLSAVESAEIAAQRALVLNGGAAFAAHVLGAERPALDDCPAALPLSEPVWPPELFTLAGRFGKVALRLPRVPLCRVPGGVHGDVVAWLRADDEATSLPAVVQVRDCLWTSLDLGTAFAHLLTEEYAPHPEPGRVAAVRARARGVAETLYYAAPHQVRGAVQRASYGRLERRLAQLGARGSEYPVDPTGWLVIELVKALLRRAAGNLVRIAHWPAGRASAALLTHDLEPRRYAYTEGLARLLDCVARQDSPSAFGIVAAPGERHLRAGPRTALAGRDVFCHGLDHRGESVWGRPRVARGVRRARAMLERTLGRPVFGYRSPRLDRSPDLAWALDDAGFTYDSSYPDVDRENLEHYGRGVRLNLPHRTLIAGADGQLRPSRCLELPLTAPDCIQPLFAGHDLLRLRGAVEQKAAFVRATGGLYVALVHAGVFGADDAARREAHLDYVAEQLRHPETWLTTPQRLVEWWCAREGLRVTAADGAVRVVNTGDRTVDDAVLVIERAESTDTIALPRLAPGGGACVAGGAVVSAHGDGAHAA